MYFILAIMGGVIGLAVTGAAVFTVWSAFDAAKREQRAGEADKLLDWRRAETLRQWTAMDYGALLLFVIGGMLLLADLIAVIRDRESYPFYHYGYLFAAFIFMVAGMLFMVARLGGLLRRPIAPKASEALPPLQNEHGQPYQTD